MASKLQMVTEFSYHKTLELSSVRGNWQRYLKTAARIYKYPFRDQLLIHAQRPDVTACATIEFWNKKMDRWVNKGTSGIALLDDSGFKTRLKYVFDVSDTHPGRYRPQEPQLWQMQPAYEASVLESISNTFEVEREAGASFVEQICAMSQVIAEDNLPDYLEELRNTREDSFLEDLDDLNLSVRLKTLLANSIAYTVLTRCGYDADRYFDETDFEFIHDFSTYETVSVLGNASNSISKMVLLEIGRTINQQERTSKFAKQQNSVYDRATKEQPRAERRRMNSMTRELTYTQIGDYLYPDLYLPETEEDTPMGKYGMLHKTYLKENKPMLYDRLLLVGKLDGHLMDIDRRASEMVEQLTKELAQRNGVTEELKATDQMAWVQAMNNFKASAEEVVLRQLIYS